MQIQERSITREYWMVTYKCLTRRYSTHARHLGNGIFEIRGTGKGYRRTYAVFNETPKGPRPSGWLMVKQRPAWTAWEVEQLWVFPAFRGKGIASTLYKAVVNQDGMLLASGKTHTKYSKALWERFIRKQTFTIWAHDFANLDKWCDVVWDEDSGEVFSRLSLYTNIGNGDKIGKDVRLIALKKGHI